MKTTAVLESSFQGLPRCSRTFGAACSVLESCRRVLRWDNPGRGTAGHNTWNVSKPCDSSAEVEWNHSFSDSRKTLQIWKIQLPLWKQLGCRSLQLRCLHMSEVQPEALKGNSISCPLRHLGFFLCSLLFFTFYLQKIFHHPSKGECPAWSGAGCSSKPTMTTQLWPHVQAVVAPSGKKQQEQKEL